MGTMSIKKKQSSTIKRIGIATIATASALTLGACGGGGGTTTQTGAVCTSLPPLAMKSSYKVGFSQLYETNAPWRSANTLSIVEEAAKRGYELVYHPGTTSDAAEQVARMQELIDMKVDAIIIAPHDETILAPSVVAARKACIPVFIEDRAVDTNIAIPGTDYVSYLGSDFLKEGQLTADWLITKTGGQAKIIELEGTVGSSPGVQRKQGFDSEISNQAGMSILVSQSGDFNQQMGHDLTLQLLPQYPTANIIYSHNDAMSFGVIQALQELGKVPGQDITIVSIDGTKEGAQDIINGQIAEITECNPKFGPIIFDTMESYARGEQVPLVVKNVDRVFDSTNAATYLPEAF
jgi:ABC-type sugar transport system substrate-binding protein